jgi:uncharacterized membrane protein
MTQKQTTIQTPTIPEVITTSTENTTSVASAKTTKLAQAYFDANKKANEATKKADKARKDLHAAMIDEGLTLVEVSGGFIDRASKETTSINPVLIKDHLTAEQFWESVSITKTAAKKFLADAIVDRCSVVETSKENVHIRKA